jgi:hypothetical protein
MTQYAMDGSDETNIKDEDVHCSGKITQIYYCKKIGVKQNITSQSTRTLMTSGYVSVAREVQTTSLTDYN